MCIPQTKWGWIGVFVLAALIIAAPPLWWEFRHRMERDPAAPPEPLTNPGIRGSGPASHTHAHVACKGDTHSTSHLNRSRRATPVQPAKTNDGCLRKYGGIELNYTMGSRVTFQFDLCNVIKCGRYKAGWRGYNLYLCGDSKVHEDCVKRDSGASYWWGEREWCSWCMVWKYTGSRWRPTLSCAKDKGKISKIDFIRGQLQADSTSTNPLLLTIHDLWDDPFMTKNYKTPKKFYIILGVDQSGPDSMGLVKVNLLEPPPKNKTTTTSTSAPEILPSQSKGVVTIDYSKLSTRDIVTLATGYTDKNMWLDWMTVTASSMNMTNCVACSSARPTLFTTPAPLYPQEDPAGFHCMMSLTMQKNPPNCTTLSAIFPAVKSSTIPSVFTPREGNYTCFSRAAGVSIGDINPLWCENTINITRWPNATKMVWARADLFWYCGRNTLRLQLPTNWTGTCALVRLAMPLTLLGTQSNTTTNHRVKRAANTDAFDFTSETYIDAIGVPRGVPDKYKLANNIASGFESLPLISAIFPVTPIKNVDRINYIHYNVQRLSNATRDAVAGLSEQLAATSLMTLQNRMALDMLLAEKGGVCHMFGEQCCTFITNNTAPDGSVTRALSHLRALSTEMAENSGVSNPIADILDKWFGKWKGVLVSVFVSLAGMMCVMVLIGCCCIPCIRSPCNRIIIAAIEKKDYPNPPSYQMPLLAATDDSALACADWEDEAV